ncbi:hypothetical protein E2C01_055175 [Portunus trituberculatus]|uniref:Uncharacterized protein n=1 Tax=Portunus trituberculatus TaxID=210409 RepID=A0A5B7GQH6_PORTR|nr:hypothetical protein [Portunus trituberculatus]
MVSTVLTCSGLKGDRKTLFRSAPVIRRTAFGRVRRQETPMSRADPDKLVFKVLAMTVCAVYCPGVGYDVYADATSSLCLTYHGQSGSVTRPICERQCCCSIKVENHKKYVITKTGLVALLSIAFGPTILGTRGRARFSEGLEPPSPFLACSHLLLWSPQQRLRIAVKRISLPNLSGTLTIILLHRDLHPTSHNYAKYKWHYHAPHTARSFRSETTEITSLTGTCAPPTLDNVTRSEIK